MMKYGFKENVSVTKRDEKNLLGVFKSCLKSFLIADFGIFLTVFEQKNDEI